jgi:hypothetical protein
MKVEYDGVYTIKYSANGNGENNHKYISAIAINGVIENNTRDLMIVTAVLDNHQMASEEEVRLSAGDIVTLMIKDVTGKGNGIVNQFDLNILRVGN